MNVKKSAPHLRKLLLFTPRLSGGGMERVVSTLSLNAPNWVDIIIATVLNSKSSYPIKHLVIKLPEPRNFASMLKLALSFNKMLWRYRPNAVIFFGKSGVTEYLLLLNTYPFSRLILRIQNYKFEKVFNKGLKQRLARLRSKFVFKVIADNIVAISKPIKDKLISEYGIDARKITVIYNPCDISYVKSLACEVLEGELQHIFSCPVIINVGRLIRAKGQWHLIRAFRLVSEHIPEAKLVIIGEGILRTYFQKLIADLRLNNKVFLLGWRSNPFKYMARSTLFCFPSLWEGFPNVIVEALACGLPVMSADCLSGPREILAPGTRYKVYRLKKPEYAEYGILMPVMDGKLYSASDPLTWQEEAWAEEIIRCLTNPEKLSEYRAKASSRAKDFDARKIAKKYFEVLLKE